MALPVEKMEVEKMEVDVKPVTVKVETDEASEQKMDTGIKVEKAEEDSNEVDIKPETFEVKDIKKEEEIIIEIIPKEGDLAYLTVNGMVVDADKLTMTAEEVREYIEKAVLFQIDRNNPLTASNKRIKGVHAEMKERRDEFQKLARLIDIIERDQLKFLRTDKTLRRLLTKTGGVGVDLPVLPNALSAATNEELMKKGFSPRTTNVPKSISSAASTGTATPTTTQTTTSLASNTHVAPKSNPSSIKTQKPTPKPAGDIECIDLTDETETPRVNNPIARLNAYPSLVKHPAPLPPKPYAASDKSWLPVPPKPRLKVSAEERGIVLQWDMIPNTTSYAKLSSFDIFGYHEQSHLPINTLLWKKIGTVNAMTLPMACTLTQFIEGNTYHFSIRPVDVHNRCGAYSDPISIVYKQTKS